MCVTKKRRKSSNHPYPNESFECSQCGITKPAKNYQWVIRGSIRTPHKEQKMVRNSARCKECQRMNEFSKKRAVLESKSHPKPNSCQMCGSNHLKIVLDHNYKTGGFRGWICTECNTGLGKIGDDIPSVWNAIKYLYKDNNFALTHIKQIEGYIKNYESNKNNANSMFF
jgi:hypothetical protein